MNAPDIVNQSKALDNIKPYISSSKCFLPRNTHLDNFDLYIKVQNFIEHFNHSKQQ